MLFCAWILLVSIMKFLHVIKYLSSTFLFIAVFFLVFHCMSMSWIIHSSVGGYLAWLSFGCHE